ncbi:hypothetical protein LMG23992_03976 [Cupriavidus laharis]|uniref:Uncharacterized protein n=1 Tax=Cupriavidus laharis TaxID=151654 RepID=A0ABN7Z0L1_9BURK|nr:hypothetical protein LMG23992_03976 [Cupriavidus laharis]
MGWQVEARPLFRGVFESIGNLFDDLIRRIKMQETQKVTHLFAIIGARTEE